MKDLMEPETFDSKNTINERFTALINQYSKGNKSAFAKLVGISNQSLGEIVGARRSAPSFGALQKIFAALPEVSMNWLLMGRGTMLAADAQPLLSFLAPPSPAKQPKSPGGAGIITELSFSLLQRDVEGGELIEECHLGRLQLVPYHLEKGQKVMVAPLPKLLKVKLAYFDANRGRHVVLLTRHYVKTAPRWAETLQYLIDQGWQQEGPDEDLKLHSI